MPFGAARIALLAKTQVTAVAEVIRQKVGVSAVGNAQFDDTQHKFGQSSAEFDGSGDYLIVGDSDFANSIPALDEFTVEFWVRFDRTTNFEFLMGSRNTGLGTPGWAIQYRGDTDDKINLFYTNGGVTYELETTTTFTSGTWYHIAWVKPNDGNLYVYVDGTQEDSNTEPTYVDASEPIWIGRRQNGSGDLDGYIDEVRISDIARYTSGFTPSTTPFENDDNTLLLMHMDGTNGNQDFEDDNGTVRAQVGVLAYNNAQIDTADYKFGGTSLLMDGTDDYLRIDNQDQFDLTQSTWTIEAWINTDTVTSNLRFIAGKRTGTTGWAFYINNDDIVFNAMSRALPTGTNAISVNTWHHVAATRDGNVIEVFCDGTSVATDTLSAELSTNASDMYIGLDSTNGTRDWDGHIDEFRISDTVRYTTNFTPDTEPFVNDANTLLLLHMDGTDGSTTFRDDNGKGRAKVGVSAVGDAQIDTAQSQFGGSSAAFDGTGDYLKGYPEDLTAFGTNDFTVEGWFRINSTGIVQYILDTRNAAGSTSNSIVLQVRNDNKIYFFSNGANRIISTSTITTGQWYHIALVRQGGTATLYLDGSSEGTWTGISATSFVASQFLLGTYHATTAAYWNGYMDEFRVSDTARYTSSFTPSTEPFQNDANTVLLLHMDGTDGSTYFLDDNGTYPD